MRGLSEVINTIIIKFGTIKSTMELNTVEHRLNVIKGTDTIRFTIITEFIVKEEEEVRVIEIDTLFANKNYQSLMNIKAFMEQEIPLIVFRNKNWLKFSSNDNQLRYLAII
jgi:hypothetical protein